MKTRTDNLILLVLLTLIVGAYDFQFFNVHQSTYLNAYNLSEGSHVQWPSLGIPHEYKNVTDDSDFRANVRDYVLASDTVDYFIMIPEGSATESWLRNASNSTIGYDMTIDFFNDSYFLQVRNLADCSRTLQETAILYTVNLTTILAWVFIFTNPFNKH